MLGSGSGSAARVPAPCTREACATGVPGWDTHQPLFRWYCRPCAAAPEASSGTTPKMSVRNLWSGATMEHVAADGLLSVGPLQAHDSALVLLTLLG